ncbi:hypothetical protein pb186bvf_013703 [Paramecium bursaria]
MNKYTLRFIFKEQEIEYLKFTYPIVMKELLNFSIYAFIFALVNLLQFIIQGQLWYSIISGLTMIVIYFIKKLIEKKPGLLDHALAFYQIYVLVVFEINDFFSEPERTSIPQTWYYGFQCCFFHFAIFLMGHNFIQQCVMLFVVYVCHLALSEYWTMIGIINIVMYIFMFQCILMIKYNYSRTKKEEFFQNQQQEKWLDIVQKTLRQSLFLIELDNHNDALLLKQINSYAQQQFNIVNHQDFRDVVRQFVIDTEVMSTKENKEKSTNVEQLIRGAMKDYRKEHSQSYRIRHTTTNLYYKAKIAAWIQQNHVICLLLLTKIKTDKKIMATIQEELLGEISSIAFDQSQQLMQLFIHFNKQLKLPQMKLLDDYFIHNTLLNAIYFIRGRKNKFTSNLLTFQNIKTIFNNLLGEQNYELIMNKPFRQNIQMIMQVLITLMNIIKRMNGKFPFPTILIIVQDDQICFKIICRICQYNKQILSLLKKNWLRGPEREFFKSSVYRRAQLNIGHLQSQFQGENVLLLMDITVVQMILARIGQYNYINYSVDDDLTLQKTLID